MKDALNALAGFRSVLVWLPRIASVISMTVIGMFLFGGHEPWRPFTLNEIVGFVCFPVGVVIGMLLAWKWPVFGGLVSIVSLFAFYLWHIATAGSIPRGPWFAIFSSPALLFVFAGVSLREMVKRKVAASESSQISQTTSRNRNAHRD